MLIKLYFCNARIRYSMDFSFNSKRNAFIDSHSIGWIENKLNNRPRKRLGYLTPNEKLKQIINQNSDAFAS